MTEPTGGSAAETKQRITRSSIGQAGSLMDGNKQEDAGVAESTESEPTMGTSTGSSEVPVAEMSSAPSPSPLMKRTKMGVTPAANSQTTRRSLRSSNKLNTDEESDQYCWRCRKDGTVIPCQLCPRVFHLKCLDLPSNPVDDWICMECEKVMRSEHEDTKPRALVNLSMDQLITCLQYALERMKIPNSEVFQVPVDPAMEPEYHNIIAHPMDMSLLEKNIKKKLYGSTQAFLADAMWILHNSVLYNGVHNKYTMTAKAILKMCRNQMTEIETCPDCFLASCNQEPNWFCKPCRFSHPLVWAKLKGYPFWPAKALRENDGQVDCRFFGAHDKAWLPANSVFMLSMEPPAPVKNKKGSGFEEAMFELEKYISRYKARYGTFTYALVKEPYRPDYGHSTAGESKKRKLASPNSASEAPQAKRLAETAVKQEPDVVKEEKPVVKVEPEKPGVFTISDDDLLADASKFSLIKDEEMTPVVENSVLSKIEESLKVAMSDGDAHHANGNIETQLGKTEQKSEVSEISDNIPSQSTSSPSNERIKPVSTAKAETEPTKSLETNGVGESIESVETTSFVESSTSSQSTASQEHTKPVKKTEELPTSSQSSQSTEPTEASTSLEQPKPEEAKPEEAKPEQPKSEQPEPEQPESEQPESEQPESEQPEPEQPEPEQAVKSAELPSEPMETSTVQTFAAKDPEYTQKLERTIASCKSSLGVDNVEEEDASDESESESESESEEDVYYSGRRKRKHANGPKQRKDIRDVMSEKEMEVTRQLLQVMKEGLQPTIRDIVRQTLLGQTHVAKKETQAPPVEDKSQSNIPSFSATNSQASEVLNDTSKLADSEGSLKHPHTAMDAAVVPKSEPLSENTMNSENSQDSTIDPSVGKVFAEKLTWKHKCEIEAVKHNAELAAMEMRKSIELEKERALWRLRKQLEHKFKKIIEETKKKQWCAMCGKEAIFYCCWNTSYCDYPCQQKHWPNHLKTCAQISKDDGGDKKTPHQHSRTQSPGSNNSERTPQSAHSSAAPPPYMPVSSAEQISAAPQYQLMPGQQVQYMSAPGSIPPNVYQAQLPLQAMPVQSGPRISASGTPMLYPVMTPPGPPQGPPQPQGYMLNQRQPYRLAPKYS